MFRARPKVIRPTEVSAKVQTTRPITHHDPGNSSPRSATPQPPRHNRARPKRASREVTPRGRATHSRTAHERSVRPGNYASRPAEISIGQIPIRRPRRPTVITSGPTVPTRPRPDCPADRPDDRPNAAVDPKPFLKPNPHNSSPKPAPT
ncbi:unnamed protein product [Microthlaspi erraticum]|uniref:Uncharacterized protein n=1 Tax=Microthlaspi erraticum TaxID=1685480 RepID=A0A6D2I4W6_9BRAS|nr:unnamed protein product [Microthlaspi erraticum]